ncbi:hypothetical protein ABH931_000426 [Streptacidiphilus sp. MAP12-33]|uniref:ArnT family glycosyltransferase n=1 Tax=Streptacidiphilus sp. MAP12-33 TaxID=3156266 RepID=UPI0035140090
MDTFTAPPFTAADHRVPYEIPEVPDSAWSAAPSRRRDRVSRLLLLCVLVIQAALSLRLRNTADTPEANALVVGRAEVAHLLHSTPISTDLVHRFPGAPWFYPTLAGFGESWDRVAGARLIGLLCALATTAVLYALSRRLFNERVALIAAAAYAVLQSTVVLGFYASPDALAVLLVTVAAWVVVRTGRRNPLWVLAASVPAGLAVAAEYAALVVLPSLALLAVLTAAKHRGWGASLLRGLLLLAPALGLLLPFGGTRQALTGLDGALTRGHGGAGALDTLWLAGRLGGLFVLIAVAGGVAYILRERMNEAPEAEYRHDSRLLRVLLVVLLCGTAGLVPVYQAAVGDQTALARHLALGLVFAAPLVGVGISRVTGAHFRNPQLGILLWVLTLALGVHQSAQQFQGWPDGSALLSTLDSRVDAKGQYLTQVDGLGAYYLDARTTPGQWVSAAVGLPTGQDATLAAVRSGSFQVVVLDSAVTGPTSSGLAAAVTGSHRYTLLKEIHYLGAGGHVYSYRVYVLTPPASKKPVHAHRPTRTAKPGATKTGTAKTGTTVKKTTKAPATH